MRRAFGLVALALMVLGADAHAAPIAGLARDIPSARHAHGAPRARAAAGVSYLGGEVLHSNRTHLIFWQPAGSGLGFDPGYVPSIETFLARVGADSHRQTNVYGLTGQYGDDRGPAAYDSSYGGAILDTDPVPLPNGCAEAPPPPQGSGPPGWTACVSDQQIQSEVSRVVSAHRLPRTPSDIYFLITPSGLGDCAFTGPDNCALGGGDTGYCGYHSVTSDTGVLYAVIPYNAVPGHCQSDNPRPNSSTADPAISTLAHEHAEVVTDPLGTSWFGAQKAEIGDLCISQYGPNLAGSGGGTAYTELIDGGHYYVQELWSAADGGCEPAVKPDRVSFAAPRTAAGDRALSLSARATEPQGRILSFRWSFGDRQTAGKQRVEHAFTRSGAFTVRLRTTDSWGNWAFSSRKIRVTVPPPPLTRITGSPPRVTSISRVRFRFASNAAIATFECRVDFGRWASCSSPFTTLRLSPGEHRFLVRSRDTFGQLERQPASYRFTKS